MSKIWIFTVELPSIKYKKFNEQKFIAMFTNYELILRELTKMNIEIL
jgi:hypothetical protein